MNLHTQPARTLWVKFWHATLILICLLGMVRSNLRAAPPEPLPPVTTAGGSMGTCYSFYETAGEALSPYAYAAGSRWDRFDFRWNVIESTPGVFRFGPHDNVVNLDLEHDIDIVGILGSTAAWATSRCPVQRRLPTTMPPGHPLTAHPLAAHPLTASPLADLWWRPCPPDNLHLPWDHPDNAWGNYVYQTVTHFKGRVDVWEIWNEPDLGNIFWSGTVEEFAQLLKVGYQAAKAANPDATVLFGGLAYWSNPTYYIDVLDALATLEGAAAHNHFFDVMSLHLYSSVYHIGPIAASIQDTMRSRVGPRPIWLTETGVPLWDEHPTNPGVPYNYTATIEEAAAYVIQAYAGARAVGIEKFFFFRMHDEYMHENFGLMRNDLTPRPAYVSYQVAATYLHGENQVAGPFGNPARRITFYGTPHGRIDVLWNMSGTPITATRPALLPEVTLVDMYGITQTLTTTGDAFTLPLAPATANTGDGGSFIIGGPPVLLIYADTAPPTLRLDPLPAFTTPDTHTVTWHVSDPLTYTGAITHSGIVPAPGTGYWYAEIDRAPTPAGPWTRVAGMQETLGVTATAITLPHTGDWYARARARDRAGNWQPWDAASVISTTAVISRPTRLIVSLFSDANGNGVWDEDEIPVTGPGALAWRAADGALITATTFSAPTGTLYLGVAWHVSQTVRTGEYRLTATSRDHLPHYAPFSVPPGSGPLTLTLELPLQPARARVFLPLVLRR